MNNPFEDRHEVRRFDGRLPQSEDAEKGFLSCLIQDPKIIDDYSDLAEDAVYHPSRRLVFAALREMSAGNAEIDLITLTNHLEAKGKLEDVGGPGMVTDISVFVPTAALAKTYAEILREKWIRRRILRMAEELQGVAVSDIDNAERLVDQVESLAMTLRPSTETSSADALQHCAAGTMAALDHIEAVFKHRGRVMGMSTGLTDLDRMTGGLQAPDLLIIGGRPANGKTALAMQIAEHASLETRLPVAVFSMEMSTMQLMQRMLCSRASVDLQRVRDGFLGRSDIPNLINQTDQLSKSTLYVDDTPAITTAQFRARARRAKVRYGVGLIVVDYLQLMKGTTKASQDNRQQEVAEVSGTLKAVAKELHIPVIALAQLRRESEDRKSQPTLRDIRESGSIEQDADIVALIHRLDPNKKKKKKEGDEEDDDKEPTHNTELIVAKHRNGPVGVVRLNFEGKYTRFSNVTEKLYSNNAEERQKH